MPRAERRAETASAGLVEQPEGSAQEDLSSRRKIFVGGLAHKTTKNNLRDYFGRFGAVGDAVVLRWSDGRSRGFGYVTFAEGDTIGAVVGEAHNIGGREVEVKRAVPGTNKLFVGGLPQNATAAELRTYFESFGEVSDSVVMIDPTTKRSRGFGFICFAPGPEGSVAIETALAQYETHRLRGKWIEVKSAAPPHKCGKEEGQQHEKARVVSLQAATATSKAPKPGLRRGAAAGPQQQQQQGVADMTFGTSAFAGQGLAAGWPLDLALGGLPWPTPGLSAAPDLNLQSWAASLGAGPPLGGLDGLHSLLAPVTLAAHLESNEAQARYAPGLASPKKIQISSHLESWGEEVHPEEEVQVAFAASRDLQKGLEQLLRSQLGHAVAVEGKQAEEAEARFRASTSTSAASEDTEPTTKTEV